MTAMMWKGVECFAECCAEPVLSGWLCRKHYQRVITHGVLEATVVMMPKRLLGTREGFMSKVLKDSSGCWLWQGSLNNKGYGAFYMPEYKRALGAHRAAYLLFKGNVNPGMVVDHKYVSQGCPRHCVNPEHLRVITYGQNNENSLSGRKTASGYKNVRITASGNYQARIKKFGKEFTFPPTSDLSLAVEQARELRLKHFTHNTFERSL